MTQQTPFQQNAAQSDNQVTPPTRAITNQPPPPNRQPSVTRRVVPQPGHIDEHVNPDIGPRRLFPGGERRRSTPEGMERIPASPETPKTPQTPQIPLPQTLKTSQQNDQQLHQAFASSADCLSNAPTEPQNTPAVEQPPAEHEQIAAPGRGWGRGRARGAGRQNQSRARRLFAAGQSNLAAGGAITLDAGQPPAESEPVAAPRRGRGRARRASRQNQARARRLFAGGQNIAAAGSAVTPDVGQPPAEPEPVAAPGRGRGRAPRESRRNQAQPRQLFVDGQGNATAGSDGTVTPAVGQPPAEPEPVAAPGRGRGRAPRASRRNQAQPRQLFVDGQGNATAGADGAVTPAVGQPPAEPEPVAAPGRGWRRARRASRRNQAQPRQLFVDGQSNATAGADGAVTPAVGQPPAEPEPVAAPGRGRGRAPRASRQNQARARRLFGDGQYNVAVAPGEPMSALRDARSNSQSSSGGRPSRFGLNLPMHYAHHRHFDQRHECGNRICHLPNCDDDPVAKFVMGNKENDF